MRPLLIVFLGPILMLGCRNSDPIAISPDSLGMDKTSATKQTLSVGTTQLPVDVEQNVLDNGTVTLRILSQGEELEREQYLVSKNELDLVQASDAVFDPALPLLCFPSSASQPQSWQGSVIEGSSSRPASARISSALAELKIGDAGFLTDRVSVDLSITSGGEHPASRDLEFWFAKGGLIKRAFGSGTVRTAGQAAP